MSTVLVIDDDRTVRRLIEKAMEDLDVQVHTATNAQEGLEAIRQHRPDVLLLDVKLPDASGLEIAQQVHAIDPKLPVAYITISDASDVAIEAMKLGAYDFLRKPLDVAQVQDVVERALKTRRMMQVPVAIREPREGEDPNGEQDSFLGNSSRMLEVYKEIGRVAGQEVTVLICGESGTGKELVARAIYQHSRRSEHAFLAVNCAALSETLLESELFGHEKGSFTGADRRRVGKFELCDRGTIFLDEIGDMSPLVQSKVLRLLQEQQFERVGGTETIQTNVRIIAATNRDLETMVREGEFRLDLFHRLNDYRIDLPPLRDRNGDTALLAQSLLIKFSKTLGKAVHGISPEAMKILEAYSWPGNVRELQTVLKKAVIRATGPVLVPEFLPDVLLSNRSSRSGSGSSGSTGNVPSSENNLPTSDLKRFLDEREAANSTDLYAEVLQMMERYLITRVLREENGNQSKAAERLGITRGSLRHKIRAAGVSIQHVVEPGGPPSSDS